MNKKTRWSVGKATKNGVVLRIATEWEDWREFGRIQRTHSEEKGYGSFSDRFVERLYHDLRTSNKVALIVGHLKEEMIGG